MLASGMHQAHSFNHNLTRFCLFVGPSSFGMWCAGEELTYDYRFAGAEKLRCNCGALSCRGWVNKPAEAHDQDDLSSDAAHIVQRKELVWIRRQ